MIVRSSLLLLKLQDKTKLQHLKSSTHAYIGDCVISNIYYFISNLCHFLIWKCSSFSSHSPSDGLPEISSFAEDGFGGQLRSANELYEGSHCQRFLHHGLRWTVVRECWQRLPLPLLQSCPQHGDGAHVCWTEDSRDPGCGHSSGLGENWYGWAQCGSGSNREHRELLVYYHGHDGEFHRGFVELWRRQNSMVNAGMTGVVFLG